MGPEDLTVTNLGQLLFELLAREESDDPWQERLSIRARADAFRGLADQLGPRYETATLDTYEVYDKPTRGRLSQKTAVAEIQKFCEAMPERLAAGGGLIFFGRPGTGKDHLMAACMFWAILKYGFGVMWRNGPMLAQEIRDRVGSDSESERDLVNRYRRPQILAISDPVPPKGEASVFVTDTLQRIIDCRYRACRSTWATINVRDGDEAEERLAAPVVDRLRHGSLCLQCEWESYRKRG